MDVRWILLVALARYSSAYKIFQDKIPNGGNIPHPCKTNILWEGVGHQNMVGSGTRNPFGVAFLAAGSSWTPGLCNADSDGDGVTNGQELGDPSCVWSEGETPARVTGLSHPGICEPTNSTDCIARNSWEIDCSEGADFVCEGVDDADTESVTLRFDNTSVPAVETTYICQAFNIPSDKEYHIIGWKPEIDNAYVMHHTLIYGCPGGIDGFDKPVECGMVQEKCSVVLGGWTLGSSGSCSLANQGFLAGQGHYTTILMEHHWNNPTIETNYYDSSGLTLYLTPNLRPHNLGMLITGQSYLEIPPGKQSWVVDSSCPSACTTRKLDDRIYITAAHLHMHYLGSNGSIEHWRNGERLRVLFHEDVYSYDTPVFVNFAEPIELMPGDELKTVCGFKSLSKNEVTYMGEATSDEMCFGFMNYYPAEARFDTCVSYKEYDECAITDWQEDQEQEQNNSAHRLPEIGCLLLATMMMAFLGRA